MRECLLPRYGEQACHEPTCNSDFECGVRAAYRVTRAYQKEASARREDEYASVAGIVLRKLGALMRTVSATDWEASAGVGVVVGTTAANGSYEAGECQVFSPYPHAEVGEVCDDEGWVG